MTRKILALLLAAVMLCCMLPAAVAEEAAIEDIRIECYVSEFGRMIRCFKITFAEGTDLTGLNKSNILIENNFTHPYIPDFSNGIERVVTHDNYMTIEVDPFLYNRGFIVSGVKNGEVLFSFDASAITDIATEVADEFSLYKTDLLTYRLYVPEDAEGPLPVIVWFHGGGEIGDDGVAPLCDYRAAVCWAEPEYQAKHPCVVLVPHLPQGKNWYQEDTRIDVRTEVDRLIAEGVVDASRVYVVGFSYFQGALWFTTDNLDLVAACIHLLYWHAFDPDPKTGDEWGGVGWKDIADAQLPLWTCGADGDPTGGTTEMLTYHIPYMEANNPNFHYSIWTTNEMYEYKLFGFMLHHGWIPAINNQEIIDWLFAQSK